MDSIGDRKLVLLFGSCCLTDLVVMGFGGASLVILGLQGDQRGRPKGLIAREVGLRMKEEAGDGVPIARVARRYGVSRRSVYNVLKASTPAKRPVRPSKLDPFKEFVKACLVDFDLPATVLLRKIKEQGYAGGITNVKESVRKQKK